MIETFDDLTYQLNRDYGIISLSDNFQLFDGPKNTIQESLKLYGEYNISFEVQQVRTGNFGKCSVLKTDFELTSHMVIGLRLALNETLLEIDKPTSAWVYFAARNDNIALGGMEESNVIPLKDKVDFSKTQTTFQLKVEEKEFNEGVIDSQECLKQILQTSHCPKKCSLLTIKDVPPCMTVEEQLCIFDFMLADSTDKNTRESFLRCFQPKKATTYTLAAKLDEPFSQETDTSFTDLIITMPLSPKKVEK